VVDPARHSQRKSRNFCLNLTKMTIEMSDFSAADLSRIIEMAWEDRTPFEAIEDLYGLNEAALRLLMRRYLTAQAFRRWRQRVSGRVTKHLKLRNPLISRAYCPSQYKG
jgi:uncharacterized protein (TIGR03643 family)